MITQDMPEFLRLAPKPSAEARGKTRGQDDATPSAEDVGTGLDAPIAPGARAGGEERERIHGFERAMEAQEPKTGAAAVLSGSPETIGIERGFERSARDVVQPVPRTTGLPPAGTAARTGAGVVSAALPADSQAVAQTPKTNLDEIAPRETRAPTPPLPAEHVVRESASVDRRAAPELQQSRAGANAAPAIVNGDASRAVATPANPEFSPSARGIESSDPDRRATPQETTHLKIASQSAEAVARPAHERAAASPPAAALETVRSAEVEKLDARKERAPAPPAAAVPVEPDIVKQRPAPAMTPAVAVTANVDAVVEVAPASLAAEEAATIEQIRNTPHAATTTRPVAMATSVSTQIAAVIIPGEDGAVEIRLDPPELGRVRLILTSTEAGLAASLVADRPEIAELMRRHADILQRELRSAGHAEVSLSFGSNGSEPRRGAGYDRQAASSPHSETSEIRGAAVQAIRPAARGVGAGLDIRL